MELSIYLAKVLSIMFAVVGLAFLLRQAYYTKAFKAWMKDEGLMLFSAMVALVAGSALVIAHNVWVMSWEVLITIAGWGTVAKGVMMLFMPKEYNKLVESFLKASWLVGLGGGIWMVGGLVLGYFAWLV